MQIDAGSLLDAPPSNSTHTVESFSQSAERMSLLLALASGAIVALLIYVLNWGRNPVPFAEDLRSFAIIGFLAVFPVALITSGIAYALGIQAWNLQVNADRQRTWGWSVLPVALLYALVAVSVAILLLMLVEFAFQELQLIRMQAALAMGLGIALLVMWVAGNAMHLTSSTLLKMVILILGMGVYLTAITIDDPQWWRVSFSYLGKLESNVNYIFNGTLVFAGILLLVWRSYFLSDFRVAVRHGVAAERWVGWLSIALIWLAIGIMIVGIFKSRLNPFSSIMHNVAAYSLAGVFAVLMATTRWTAPRYPREFHAVSLALVAVLLVTLGSRALHVVNTVGLEVVSFMLGLLWLVQFARTTESIAARLEPVAPAR